MQIDRRTLMAALAAVATTSGPADALTDELFTAARFEAVKKARQPILVHIWAGWCPTCKAQEKVISDIKGNPKYKNLAILSVNFDTQKDIVRSFGAHIQSVLIGYKGSTEIGRETGITSASAIERFLDKIVAS